MNKIFISKNNGKTNHAGSKARNDVEKILCEKGYTEVNTALNIKIKIIRKIFEYIRYFFICNFNKNSIIIHQYPNLPFLFNFCLNMAKKLNGFKIITIVHDLSLRAKGTRINNAFLQNYVLKFSDCVIVHNNFMKEYIIKNMQIKDEKIVVLGIFDYLMSDLNNKNTLSSDGNIIIAGNLDKNKCGYVYKLNGTTQRLKYNLYGPNYDNSIIQDNCNYKGVFSPEELPYKMQGAWGLVWDGPSVETCADLMGQYLKLNNPHKTSLYIACGIPVIVWSQAAISKFIEDKELGLIVDSIYDIEEVINNLTPEDYYKIKENVNKEGKKLRSGFYMSEAVKKAVSMLEGE